MSNAMIENNKSTTKTVRSDQNKINLLVASSNISTVNSIESTDIEEETRMKNNEDTRFDVSSTLNNVEVNSSPNSGKPLRFSRDFSSQSCRNKLPDELMFLYPINFR